MQNDVLVDFYLASVKVQSYEYHLCGSNLPEEYSSSLLRETETVRRELGAAMMRLLHSALPSFARNRRLFRAKYVEEVDLRNLEKCLVAAANKVVTFNAGSAPRDYDLRPAQPSAAKFLDVLSQVQFLVSNLIELALASCDRRSLRAQSLETKRGLSASAECIRVSEKCKSIERSHTMDSLTVKPTVGHRTRFHLRTNKNRSTSTESPSHHGSEKRKLPVSTKPQASTSHPDSKSRAPQNSVGNSVIVEVRIGPNTFHEKIRLPPTSMLVISNELCQRLLELDEAAAQFEFEFVRTLSRRLRTVHEANELQLMAVLFSETLMWGLAVRLFSVRQLADRDPNVLLSLPRLAILVGTRILPDSPIGAHRLAAGRRLPFMCAKSRTDLAYLARQLYALRLDQLFRLARWLGPRGLPNLDRSRSIEPTMPAYSPTGPVDRRALNPSTTSLGQSLQPRWCGSLSPPLSRRTCKANLAGLHRIYKTIATVADRFTSDFPTELRFILQSVIEMHDTSEQDAVDSGAIVPGSPPPSPSSESSDTELEDELVVDEKAFSFNSKCGSLAKLLDWSDVISHRETSKTRLADLLRNSTVSALKWAKSEDSLMLSDMHQPTEMQKISSSPAGDSLTFPMELGVDVAAMLAGDAVLTSCDQVESSSSELSELRSYLVASGDASEADSSVSSSVTHRFHKLHLGSSVEGVRTPIDQAFHHLPAWQPDRLCDSGDSYLTGTDSDPEDRRSDSDDERYDGHHAGEADGAISYQVGRQCASCLRTFNLFRRRHHCRRCGHIFCTSCCNHWQTVEGLATDKVVRICSECHEFLNLKYNT